MTEFAISPAGITYPRVNMRDEYGRDPVPYESPRIVDRVISMLIQATAAKESWLRGIDLSKWNGVVDWGAVVELYDFAFIKACQDRTIDSQYDRNTNEAAKRNFDFGLYAFTDPQYSSGGTQGKFFADLVAGNLSMVMDAERTGGKTAAQLTLWYEDFYNELDYELPKKKKDTYNRSSFWNPNVSRDNLIKANTGLWIARYADWLAGPWADGKYIPLDWDDWVLWQYTDRGDGKAIGESYGLDLNYFQGDRTAFNIYYGLGDTPPPIEPPGGTNLWEFETIRKVRYRTQPVVNPATEVDFLYAGNLVQAKGIVVPNGYEAWLEFDMNAETYYTALIHWGTQYHKPL